MIKPRFSGDSVINRLGDILVFGRFGAYFVRWQPDRITCVLELNVQR
jgi:hypothetical protein